MDPELKAALGEILGQSKANAGEIEKCERTLRGSNGEIGLVAQVTILQKSVKWIAVTMWGIVVFLLLTHAEQVATFVGSVFAGPPPFGA